MMIDTSELHCAMCRSNDFCGDAEGGVLRLTGDFGGPMLGHVCDSQGRVLYNILRLVDIKINEFPH